MLQRLVIQHFRNIDTLECRPHPQFNLITGPNGAGKTSFLEAIYFLSHGRSFRTQRLARLIQQESSDFSLFAELFQQDQVNSIGLARDQTGEGKLKLNGNLLSSHVSITQLMPSLLINPELYSQFWQGSAPRRAILDWGLFYEHPEFLSLWQRCSRILKQRNAALRQHQPSYLITLWDEELISLSEKLEIFRKNYFENLLEIIFSKLKNFLDHQSIQLLYQRGWPSEKNKNLGDYLKTHLDQDQQLGHTYYGPHRADIKIKVHADFHQANAQEILSRGQQKKLITTLRLAQGQLLEQNTGQSCLYLLDDLASELDIPNRNNLLEQLSDMSSQIFLTALTPEIFKLDNSQVVQVGSTISAE